MTGISRASALTNKNHINYQPGPQPAEAEAIRAHAKTRPRGRSRASMKTIRAIASDDASQHHDDDKRKRNAKDPKKNGHIDLHDLWSK
jgi:hypothetical protein